jgi:hypothetical protein
MVEKREPVKGVAIKYTGSQKAQGLIKYDDTIFII